MIISRGVLSNHKIGNIMNAPKEVVKQSSSVQKDYPYRQKGRALQNNRAPLANLLYQEAQLS
jgi:hypothetical protein